MPLLPLDSASSTGKDEAGGELAQRAAGVHQGRGVGNEEPVRHEPVEGLGHFLHRADRRAIPAVGLGDRPRHPPEQVLGRLDRLTGVILDQIALLEDRDGIGRQRTRVPWGGRSHGHSPLIVKMEGEDDPVLQPRTGEKRMAKVGRDAQGAQYHEKLAVTTCDRPSHITKIIGCRCGKVETLWVVRAQSRLGGERIAPGPMRPRLHRRSGSRFSSIRAASAASTGTDDPAGHAHDERAPAAPASPPGSPRPPPPRCPSDPTPLSRTLPMPIRQSSSTVQPCRITRCPTPTRRPTMQGTPSSTCTMVPSCRLVSAPITIGAMSPRSTAPYQTLASCARASRRPSRRRWGR